MSTAPEPTAIIVVAVHPTGQPGQIALSVIADGPAALSLPETVYVLRSAADTIQHNPEAWSRTPVSP